MVLVGNEDEETTCEDEDRANANGKIYYYTYNMVITQHITVISLQNDK